LIYAFKSVNFLVHLEISVYVQVASQCLAESTLWVDDEQPALYRKGQCPADMPGV